MHKHRFLKSVCYILALLLSNTGCKDNSESQKKVKKYSSNIGDIAFDPSIDDTNFKPCDSTKIRSGRNALALEGDRSKIGQACLDAFNYSPEFESFSGYVTVRFLVNCNNESGRFRAQSTDWNFALKACPESLTTHLVTIVSSLDDWSRTNDRYAKFDLAKYINFKIVNGKIEHVLQ